MAAVDANANFVRYTNSVLPHLKDIRAHARAVGPAFSVRLVMKPTTVQATAVATVSVMTA